jgi:hypothetical protein
MFKRSMFPFRLALAFLLLSSALCVIMKPLPPLTMVHFVRVNPYLTVSNTEELTRAKKVAEEWMTGLPARKYSMLFWSDKEVRERMPYLVPILSKIKAPEWISDILRYQILEVLGGVYLDSDVLFVHSFDKLFSMFNSSFTVCESPWRSPGTSSLTVEDCSYVTNVVIAVPEQHPVIKCAVTKSMQYTQTAVNNGMTDYYNLDDTGPSCWTSCVREIKHISVLSSWTFLPCEFGSCDPAKYQEVEGVYGVYQRPHLSVLLSQNETR